MTRVGRWRAAPRSSDVSLPGNWGRHQLCSRIHRDLNERLPMNIVGKIAQTGAALWIFGLASLMLIGHFVPRVVRPASTGLAVLMLGAIGMHFKVNDPVKRALPAMSVFTGAALSAVFNNGRSRQTP